MQMMVDLSEDQVAALERLSEQRQKSGGQLLQDAVTLLLQPQGKPHLLDFFGALRGQLEDGMVFQDRMRREWDRTE